MGHDGSRCADSSAAAAATAAAAAAAGFWPVERPFFCVDHDGAGQLRAVISVRQRDAPKSSAHAPCPLHIRSNFLCFFPAVFTALVVKMSESSGLVLVGEI